MPRFDPPHYLMERDGLRMREAPRQYAHGNYLGATASSGKKLTKAEVAERFKNLPLADKKREIKKNKAQIVAALRAQGVGEVSVNDDGTLRLIDMASKLDDMLRRALDAPAFSVVFDSRTQSLKQGPSKKLSNVIDEVPLLNVSQKQAIKQAPFTSILNVFNPILGLLNDPADGALVEVMRTQGKVYDLTSFPFFIKDARRFDISLTQPLDDLFDQPSRNNLLRSRTMIAFIVLYFRKWVELHAALVRKSIELVVGKDDTKLVSTLGDKQNTPESPSIVDRLPQLMRGEQAREGTFNNRVVYRQTVDRKTVYYALSEKGLRDRKAALQADYDRRYAAYVQDFKFWHPDFAARVGIVKATEGKTEQQALDKVAAEYNLLARFARDNLPAKFHVDAGQQYGFGVGAKNGTRADLKGLSGLGAEPGAVGISLVTAEGASLTIGPATVAVLVGAAVVIFGAGFGLIAAVVLASMGYTLDFFVSAEDGEVGVKTGKAGEPSETPASGGGGEGKLQAQSAGGGISPVLVLAAVGLGILALRKANA